MSQRHLAALLALALVPAARLQVRQEPRGGLLLQEADLTRSPALEPLRHALGVETGMLLTF